LYPGAIANALIGVGPATWIGELYTGELVLGLDPSVV
jgi:hypothetical protein